MLMIEKQNYLKASHKSDSLLKVDGAVRRILFSVTRIKSSNQIKCSIQWSLFMWTRIRLSFAHQMTPALLRTLGFE